MTAPIEQRDKAQIGLTPAAASNLDRLMGTGWFQDRQDVYRVAIGVALARQLTVTPEELVGVTTSYNFAGGVDRDGRVRAAISLLYPAESARPAAFAEILAHAGLAYLSEQIVDNQAVLADVLGAPAVANETQA